MLKLTLSKTEQSTSYAQTEDSLARLFLDGDLHTTSV